MIRGARVAAGATGVAALAYLGALAWARRPGPDFVPEADLEEIIDSWFSEFEVPVRHRYIGTSAGRIHCLDLGDPDGAPLLFIPGLGTAAAGYYRLLAELGRRRRVIGVDRPGTGLSDGVRFRGHPRRSWVAMVGELAAALDLGRFDVCGHSLGGFVAGAFAVERPELVRSVVLLSPVGIASRHPWSWAPSLVPGMMDILAAVERGVERHGLDGVDGLGLGPLRIGPDRDHFHARSSSRFPADSDLATLPRLVRLRTLRPESSLLPELGLLSGRVLIVWGDRDREVPLEPVRRELRAYPGLELEVATGGDHLFPFDRALWTAQLVTGWLDGPEGGAESLAPVGEGAAAAGRISGRV
ncbi:MAG: alpha/beta hydrolase [Candidatus Dormiibacterota bacterium]